jgi:hypothetical protein
MIRKRFVFGISRGKQFVLAVAPSLKSLDATYITILRNIPQVWFPCHSYLKIHARLAMKKTACFYRRDARDDIQAKTELQRKDGSIL